MTDMLTAEIARRAGLSSTCLNLDETVDFILALGEEVTKIEKQMSYASRYLKDTYGVTVEDVLRERENRNGNKT